MPEFAENESTEDLKNKDKNRKQNDMFDYDWVENEKESGQSDENKSNKGKSSVKL